MYWIGECEGGGFRCKKMKNCIEQIAVCDGINQCYLADDEGNCGKYSDLRCEIFNQDDKNL